VDQSSSDTPPAVALGLEGIAPYGGGDEGGPKACRRAPHPR
jgi:hypothetical protein